MYSLDINFLKDRPDYQPASGGKKGPAMQVGDRTALMTGAGVGLLLPVVIGGWWFFTQLENGKLQKELEGKEAKSAQVATLKKQVDDLNAEATQIEQETQALASLFNTTLKPVSAILQDVRDRVPSNLYISQLQQTIAVDPAAQQAIAAQQQAAAAAAPPPAAPPAAGAPGAAPPPAAAPPAPPLPPWEIFSQKVEIQGTAKSFDEVNDFLLTLKQSPFFDEKEIKIVQADLVENPLQNNVVLAPVNPQQQTNNQSAPQAPEVELPKVVQYKIETAVNKATAAEVVRELNRKGAIGLATRIQTLQNKGVIQP